MTYISRVFRIESSELRAKTEQNCEGRPGQALHQKHQQNLQNTLIIIYANASLRYENATRFRGSTSPLLIVSKNCS